MHYHEAATKKLRSMLDERGVKWMEDCGESGTIWYPPKSISDPPSAFQHHALGKATRWWGDKITVTWRCYPEQAIEATLGREPCHLITQDNYAETEGMGDVWIECDKCHWQTSLESIMPEINYCPGCGRKVES